MRGTRAWAAGAALAIAVWAVSPLAVFGAPKHHPSPSPRWHPPLLWHGPASKPVPRLVVPTFGPPVSVNTAPDLRHPPVMPTPRGSGLRPHPVPMMSVKPGMQPSTVPNPFGSPPKGLVMPPRPSPTATPRPPHTPSTPAPNSNAPPKNPQGGPKSITVKKHVKGDPDRIHITTDYMKYDRKGKVAFCDGNVIILQADQTITTAEVQFDQGQKISYMNKPVHVLQEKDKEPPTTLDSGRMTVFHKEKRLIAEGGAKMVRSKDPYAKPANKTQKAKVQAAIKKEDTVITSDSLEYWTQRKDANFKKDVIINGKKKAWGDTAFMDNAKNVFTLDGHVKVVQINGNWLIKEGIVKADTPDESRDEALRERSTLWCDHLVMDQNTNDAVATGAIVRVEQKGKVATGHRAVFSDSNHTITMTEDVRVQQANGDWLTATKAVFHNDTEVFEAFSGGSTQVQTEFAVPDKNKSPGPSTPPSTPPGNTPSVSPSSRVEMDFDANTPNK